MQVMSNIQ